METPKKADCTWVELYCLDGLSSEERRLFDNHAKQCKNCSQEISTLQEVVEKLLYHIQHNIKPPNKMKKRVLNHILQRDINQSTPVTPPQKKEEIFQILLKWSSKPAIRLLKSALIASVTILLLISFFKLDTENFLLTEQPSKPNITLSYPIPLDRLTNHQTKAYLMEINRHKRVIMIEGKQLPPTDGKKVYHLWFLKGSIPISGGTFHTNHKGEATYLANIPNSPKINTITVTLEPDNQSKQPQGVKILFGKLN